MKKDMLVFFAAIVILGGTFAGYFNWLLIQPKPGAEQMKLPPPKLPPAAPKSEVHQAIEAHPTTSWHSLEPMQQEALAPLSQQWDNLPELQQHRLLKTAKRYPNFTSEQKQRFHNRLAAWSKLTPEQREQVKQMFGQDQAINAQQPASSNPVPPLLSQP